MKVQFEGREFWIEFEHGRTLNLWSEEVEMTTCLIRDGSKPRPDGADLMMLDRDTLQPVIARGTVVRYFKDPPNRDVAREHALSKALADLDERVPSRAPGHHGFDVRDYPGMKARRAAFWRVYLTRKVKSAPGASQTPRGTDIGAPTASQGGG